MPKIVVAIVTAAFAWIIGFAFGAILTKPNVEATEKAISAAQSAESVAKKICEDLKSQLDQANGEKRIALTDLTRLDNDNQKTIAQLQQKIFNLQEQNKLLKEQVDFVIQKR